MKELRHSASDGKAAGYHGTERRKAIRHQRSRSVGQVPSKLSARNVSELQKGLTMVDD